MTKSGQAMTLNDVVERVATFISEHHLLDPGEKIVVAVSGGADSVCLFHILWQLRREWDIELVVAHLNHKLRGAESDADAAYVAELAKRFAVPAIIETEDVGACHKRQRGSLEEVARELRYAFLAKTAKSVGASKVAVGHTRDDNVETILLHLIRGTGIAGLRGLLAVSEIACAGQTLPVKVVRPLLEISREQTIAYCHRHELQPRLDSSNISPRFLRNRIRLGLLPLLRSYNPNIDNALLRLSTIAGDDISFVEKEADAQWAKLAKEDEATIYLDSTRLSALPASLQRQVFRKALEKLTRNLKDIEAIHIEAMLSFLKKPAGKRLSLPYGLRLFSGYGHLILTSLPTPPCPFPPLHGSFELNIPGETAIPGWKITAAILDHPQDEGDPFAANLDLERCGTKLSVRTRQPGDRFQPLGMGEMKKLQDFMVDCKIPRTWRDRIPLVCSPSHILWVVGWRISEIARIRVDTGQVVHLKFKGLSDASTEPGVTFATVESR